MFCCLICWAVRQWPEKWMALGCCLMRTASKFNYVPWTLCTVIYLFASFNESFITLYSSLCYNYPNSLISSPSPESYAGLANINTKLYPILFLSKSFIYS
jgi:hypothetical protein